MEVPFLQFGFDVPGRTQQGYNGLFGKICQIKD
jgi:hypothetical protein